MSAHARVRLRQRVDIPCPRDGQQMLVCAVGNGVLASPRHQDDKAQRSAARAGSLRRAWGVVHAFPDITNTASNVLCRSVGFTLLGERLVTFAGRELRTGHWRIDPSSDLT